ncbi:Ethanolamine-phosphate cytidylyltransferase [Ceratobasidium sp. 423]|nr:Ethanolamine-phosphate cytidylyltransferase [Ceratobasidium sp. 423]
MPAESPKARLWLDGCFDGFHFAHANAVRQSRKFGDYVIVGVHSDRVIEKWASILDPFAFAVAEMRAMIETRGPPCSTNAKGEFNDVNPKPTNLYLCLYRYNLLRGCRWVDEVAEDVPYITDMEFVAKYNIETRLLAPEEALWKLIDEFAAACSDPPPIIDLSDPNNRHDTLPRDKSRDVVYIGGSWDVFGSGHVELLRRAHQTRKDTYLIVGVWGEQAAWDECGERPLLDTLERVLAVLQCRYTSAVIIDAPVEPTVAFLSEITAKFVVNPGDNFAITNDIQASW